VLALERVPGAIMIKGFHRFPGCLIVTACTPFLEGGLMHVTVTIGAAGERQAFPLLLPVTFFASHVPVRPFKGKSGIIVIKRHLTLFEPLPDTVAFFAAVPQLPFVKILVTGDAARIRQHIRRIFFPRHPGGFMVTAAAIGDGFMQSVKDIPGFTMIKVLGVELDQLEFFAMVFRVTSYTIRFFVPVIASPRIYPGFQFFMTVQALGDIRFLPVGVAFFAIGYSGKVRVNLAKFAWRDQ